MTDDAELRLLERLRHLRPDLPAPGDRMERVRRRVLRSGPRGVSREYTLVFRYAEGPPVRVSALIGCDPPLLGDTLKAWEAPGTDLAGRLAAVVAGG